MQPTEKNNPEPQTLDFGHCFSHQYPTLIDYLQVIVKRRRMIFTVTLAAVSISLAFSFILPNIYVAKTMIVPVQEDKSLMPALMGQLGGLAGLAGGSLGGPTQADLYVTLLKSDSVKDALIDKFKLMDVYKKKFHSDASKELAENSVIDAGKKDGVITITVEDTNPRRAADLANAYIEELGKIALLLSVSEAGKSRMFFEDRLTRAKADLSLSEEALRQFQAKNKAIDLSGQVKASIEGIAKLKAELATQEVKLANLTRQFTDTSQEVKSATATVTSLKAQIMKLEGGEDVGSIPTFSSMPYIGREYIRLMREVKVQESLVELLTKQYEIARLTESKDIPSFQIIDKARIPDKKTKPRRLLIVLSVTIYAIVMSILTLVVMHRLKGNQQMQDAIYP